MADYTNRIVVDTASAVSNVDKLDKGLKAAGDSLDDVGKHGGRAADDGMKKFSGGLLQATRAAQDFQAAGMMGISNNIIEVGARFGPFGVAAGAALTAVALNWKSFSGAVEDFASRPVVDTLIGPFREFGSVISTAFKDGVGYVDQFFDAVLGANVEEAKTKLVDFEGGLKKVELQLKANKEAQEELTSAGELDAGQIAKLNGLREESVELLKEQERLQNLERIKKEYGEGASSEEIARGEAFKKTFGGGSKKAIWDELAAVYGPDKAAEFISRAERGQLPPDELNHLLTANADIAGVVDRITGRTRPSAEAIKDLAWDFGQATQGKDPQAVRTSEMMLKNAMPIFMANAIGAVLPQQDVGMRDLAKAAAGVAPEFGPEGQIFADEAARMADPRRQRIDPTVQFMAGLGQDVYGPPSPHEGRGRRNRRQQAADLLNQVRRAGPIVEGDDEDAMEQLKMVILQLLAERKGAVQREEAHLQVTKALANSVQNGQVDSERLRIQLNSIMNGMRQRNPSLLPSW